MAGQTSNIKEKDILTDEIRNGLFGLNYECSINVTANQQ